MAKGVVGLLEGSKKQCLEQFENGVIGQKTYLRIPSDQCFICKKPEISNLSAGKIKLKIVATVITKSLRKTYKEGYMRTSA